MKRLVIIPLIFWLIPFGFSQSGAWMPANADYSYPRTLFKAGERANVQAHILNDSVAYYLYGELYDRAVNYGIPGTLDNDSKRRLSAHNAKNCAFIYLLNRKPVPSGLDTLTTTESNYFRDKSLTYLSKINTDVEPFPTGFDAYLWRSNEIADNLIAYDLLKGAGVADSTLDSARGLLVEYLGKLHSEATTELFGLGFFSTRINNHAIRTASVFGLGAVVLNDVTSSDGDEQPINWLNTGLWHQDNVLWRDSRRQSEPGVLAGYAEGPHYLKFGGKHLLQFNHAMGNFLPDTLLQISNGGNTRSIQNPWHDSSYHKLWEWMTRIRMPDGRMPSLEDSFTDHCMPELALTEHPEYLFELHFSHFAPGQMKGLYRQLKSSTDDLVADFIASQISVGADTFPRMQLLETSGDLIYRTGWDSNAVWYHMYAQNGRPRNNGVGHNQADVGSFMFMGFGEYMAFDPGYLKWDRRGEVGNAEDHNMILVDGDGPSTGSIGAANGADGFLERGRDGLFVDFGEVRTGYFGAEIYRNSFFIRDEYVILGDYCTDNSLHNYEWRMHGAGLQGGDSISGVFTLNAANGIGTWQKNGVTLEALVLSNGGTANYLQTQHGHEFTYDSLKQHTMMQVQANNTDDASFLSIFSCYESSPPSVTGFLGSGYKAVRVNAGGNTDLAMMESLPASVSGLSGDLDFEGGYGIYSLNDQGEFDFLAANTCDSLGYGNDLRIGASSPVFIVLEQKDSVTYDGYIHTQGNSTVSFTNLDFVPQTVLGAPVVNWNYANGVLAVEFDGDAEFSILEELIVGQLENEKITFDVFPNPASGEVLVRAVSMEWSGNCQIELRDLNGRLLRTSSFQNGRGSLNLGGVPAGFYFISLRTDSNVQSRKLVVK